MLGARYFNKCAIYSKGVRKALFFRVFLGILGVIFNLSFVYTSKKLVDVATGVYNGNIYEYAFVLILLILLKLTVNAADLRVLNSANAKLSFNIRSKLYSSVMRAEWEGKENLHSGDAINRMEIDVSRVASLLSGEVPSFITTFFQLGAAFIFLSFMDLTLALILVCITPIFLAFSKVFFRKMRFLTKEIRSTESQVQTHLQETLMHKGVLKSFEKETYVEKQLNLMQEKEYRQILSRTRIGMFTRTVMGAAFSFGYLAAFLWGVFGIYKGAITFGVMTAFLQLVSQIQGPSARLARQIPAFVNATASIDRLEELEDLPSEVLGKAIILPAPVGLRFDNVSFSYLHHSLDTSKPSTLSKPIFNHFSFDFKPGGRYAVEGETGVGKSTMFKLMLGFLTPSSGSVTLYSQALNEKSTALTRGNFAYVPQGNTLFSGTIRENLLLGDEKASSDDMKHALMLAEADFVYDLPEGLETLCGEGASRLSEGQAQRIAIARGLLRPGSIMLFDEFSSALDAKTEEKIMQNLVQKKTTADKTMIFITHKKQVSEYCDEILEL